MKPSAPILLVEDSDDDAELTIRAFRRAGVRTPLVRVLDGQAAFDYLVGRASGEPPVAVLLDLNLPGMGGLELLKAIEGRESVRQVPVIVMTTSSDDEDRVAALARGAVSFVRKPVYFDQFVRAVKTLGLHWSASLAVFGTADR